MQRERIRKKVISTRNWVYYFAKLTVITEEEQGLSSVDKCRVKMLQGSKEYGHALVFSKTFREGGKVVGAWLTCPLQCGVSYQVRLNDLDNLIPSTRGKEDHEDKCMLFKLREVNGMSRMTFKAFLSKIDRGEIKTYTVIEADKGVKGMRMRKG